MNLSEPPSDEPNPYDPPKAATREPDATVKGFAESATRIRYGVMAVTTLSAVLLYVDRIFLAWMLTDPSFKATVELSDADKTMVKEAFFWAYALGQLPAAYLAERYGKRPLMTIMILAWSIFTVLTGSVSGLAGLVFARLGCGLAQAGAYPVSSGLIGRWVHSTWRGSASALVAVGGRLGLTLAPSLTAAVIVLTGTWRGPGILFGIAGIAVAAAFWFAFRESPEEHPRCNVAEREYLAEGRTKTDARGPQPFPWRAILTNRSLWLMCAVQFLTNVGWAFVANSLADYYSVVHKITGWNGMLSMATLSLGMPGLFAGGFLTDWCTLRWGPRLGRLVPIVGTRIGAGLLFILCMTTGNLWLLVPLIGLMAFTTDAGVPAMWAFTQDVGGKRIASVLAWTNMWGNFGAALQPRIFSYVLLTYDINHDYREGFLVSGSAFFVAAVLSLGINAARPIERD